MIRAPSTRAGLVAVGCLALAAAPLVGWTPDQPSAEGFAGAEGFFYDVGRGHHGIGLALAGWMLWRRRAALAAAPGAPGLPGLLLAGSLLMAAAALAAWASHTGAQDLRLPAIGLAMLGVGFALEGGRGARRMIAPALTLLVSMPIPIAIVNVVLYPMQRATAVAVSALLSGLGVEHALLGEQIRTAGHVFYVIEGCAGLRTLQSMTLAALLYGELLGRGGRQPWILAIATPLIALAVNQLRVLTIVLWPDSGLARDHTAQGLAMVVLGVVVLALVDLVAERLEASGARGVDEGVVQAVVPAAAAGAPDGGGRGRLVALIGVAGFVVFGALVPEARPPEVAAKRAASLPIQLDGWRARRSFVLDRQYLGSVNGSDHVARIYERSAPGDAGVGSGVAAIEVSVLVDDRRRRHQDLFSRKAALGRPGLEVLEEDRVALDGPDGRRVAHLVVRSVEGEAEILHWFVASRSVAGEVVWSVAAGDESAWRSPRPILSVRLMQRRPAPGVRVTSSLRELASALDRSLREMGLASTSSAVDLASPRPGLRSAGRDGRAGGPGSVREGMRE